MKQLLAGIALMALILAAGFCLESRMEQIHHPQARDLENAAAAAGEENWEYAAALLIRAKKSWDGSRNLTAALVHHDPLNDIDTRFAELSVYAALRSGPEFRSGCAALAQILRSLPKSHGLHWWNLL